MPQSPDMPTENKIPLVVDMDGTLLKTDVLWEYLARRLRQNPFSLIVILFWWMRGRAFLKKKLAARLQPDPATLPFNEPFLAWLREQKSTGRPIILATAADLQMALPVARHAGIFDEVLASDGRTNLRSGNKLKLLIEKFGERGFDYAGNSSADLAVWRGARQAIIVNASHSLAARAAQCAKPGATFLDGYSPFFIPGRFLNELFCRSGYLVAMIAGLLLAAAFPKLNVAGFAWVAPALLVFAANKKSSADAFRAGYVGGLSFWLASLYWLLFMPAPGFSILGWFALSAYVALFPAIWLVIVSRVTCHMSRSWTQRLLWSLGGAATWVALEMVRARLFGGFPWSFIGGSQADMVPLIQIASVTGVYGVSFLVVWTSLSLFSAGQMILQKPATRFAWQSEIILPFVAVIAVFVFGMMPLREPTTSAGTLRITLVQPSVPQTLIWDEKESTNRFQELLALSEETLTRPSATLSHPMGEGPTNKTDLLIWPESAVPELDEANYIAITNLVRTHHVWLVFNADDVEPRPNARDEHDNDVFNAAFLCDPDGKFAGVYHKQALVIFGEYIPLEHSLPFIKYLTPITGSFAAGTEPVQFEINPNRWGERPREPVIELNNGSSGASPHQRIKMSPLICFEDTFPALARKAAREDTDFLVNLTNDGWFGDSAEQWQHEVNAIFRAVENGIPLVRCANNGVTCWIDAHGRVRDLFRDKTGSVYSAGAMTIDLPLQPHTSTFYNRHGDWFGWGCVILAVIIAFRNFLRSRGR